MKIRHYAYFLVFSDTLTPNEITEQMAIQPSTTKLMGSRSSTPRVPRSNMWQLDAGDFDTPEELIIDLVQRVEPSAESVRRLASTPETSVGISVVRYFNDPDGEEENLASEGPFEKLAGQHQRLGFHIDLELMARLQSLQCELDFDEYG